MTLPAYQAIGAIAGGTGTIAPAWPTHLTNDVALLFVESANQAISLSSAQGFVEILPQTRAQSEQGTGTAGAASASRLAVFWCRATGAAMVAPTVADSGDHTIGVIITIRGCVTTGNPFDVVAGDVKTVAGTALSLPGSVTTIADCLIVLATSRDDDDATAHFSSWTNADLSSLTERFDSGDLSGNGGGIGIAEGGKAAAGAFGATAVTSSVSNVAGFLAIALRSTGNIYSPDAVPGTTHGATLTRSPKAIPCTNAPSPEQGQLWPRQRLT